jgi:hypothetical protein
MRRFLADFDGGRRDGRYVVASLPNLPFADASFDLALCSHLLFLYSDHLSLEFHIASIREMLRVAVEVRIFPLLTLGCERSMHLGPLCRAMSEEGYVVDERQVDYEFQRGGNSMLCLARGAYARVSPSALDLAR